MIKILKFGEGRSGPIVCCDHCGERIQDAKNGNFMWMIGPNISLPEDGKLYFTHKRCCGPFERSFDMPEGCMLASGELSWFPIYLERNINLDRAEAERWVEKTEEELT